MPAKHIVDGFKGVIDFYLWKGVPCARSWPYYRPRPPYTLEASNQQAFAYINKLWSTLPPYAQDALRQEVVGTPWTAKDMLVMLYMKGIPIQAA